MYTAILLAVTECAFTENLYTGKSVVSAAYRPIISVFLENAQLDEI